MKNEVKTKYNLIAGGYYKMSNKYHNKYLEHPAMLNQINKLVLKNRRVLDIGCGYGLNSKILLDRGAKVDGIDISKNMIETARIYAPGAHFVVGTHQSCPTKATCFTI